MLRQLRRVALESRLALPPTFLCPWTAALTTESHTTASSQIPPSLLSSTNPPAASAPKSSRSAKPKDAKRRPALPSPSTFPGPSSTTAPKFHDSISTYLPLLQAQKQIYINVHIHAKSYLVTQGDTIRLPFLMHGVEPGDILRLNRAITLGSRDFTLRAPARQKRGKSNTASTVVVADPTPASPLSSLGQRMPGARPTASIAQEGSEASVSEEVFVPHMMAGQIPYLDDRLYVCRAIVMGVESEPMRIMEKTKRRQRHVRHVKSKHKYTVLRIKELRVRTVEEIEAEAETAAAQVNASRAGAPVKNARKTEEAQEVEALKPTEAVTTDVEDLKDSVLTAVDVESQEGPQVGEPKKD